MKKVLLISLAIVILGVFIFLPTAKGEENLNYFLISDYTGNSFSVKISKNLLQTDYENLNLLVEYPENLNLTSIDYDKTHMSEENILFEENSVIIQLFPNDIINTYLSSDSNFLIFNFSGSSTDIITVTAYFDNRENVLEEHSIQAKIENIEVDTFDKDYDNLNSNMGSISIENNSFEKNQGTNDSLNLTEKSGESNFTNLTSNSSQQTKETVSNSETITYKGSSNNYLSSLSVEDYSLNTEFNKTNTVYFITTSDEITSVNINAVADDSSSEVSIYGADTLSSGQNKIIISVIAEDGSVRNYRVYITLE